MWTEPNWMRISFESGSCAMAHMNGRGSGAEGLVHELAARVYVRSDVRIFPSCSSISSGENAELTEALLSLSKCHGSIMCTKTNHETQIMSTLFWKNVPKIRQAFDLCI